MGNDAFVSRSRTLAAGASVGVGGLIGDQVDLSTYDFAGNDYDHSGQVNRSIQETYTLYQTLVIKLHVTP